LWHQPEFISSEQNNNSATSVKDTRNQLVQQAVENNIKPPLRKTKAGPPPKPPLSTKPNIAPKPARTNDSHVLPKQNIDKPIETTRFSSYASDRPVAPPRNKTNKAERSENVDEVDASSIYIAPTAAPLDPAMDVAGAAPTRRREQKRLKDAARDAQLIDNLRAICTDADPTKLYRNMVKIGQG
jgi:p21-activated kinase 1